MYSLMTGHVLAASAELDQRLIAISLCKASNSDNPSCVILNIDQELFLLPSIEHKAIKISSFVKDIQWHTHHDILATISHRDLVTSFTAFAFHRLLGHLAFCELLQSTLSLNGVAQDSDPQQPR